MSMSDLTGQKVSQRSVRTWVRKGLVVLLHPGVLALADCRDDWLIRAHAATLHTGGQLSHTTALALWGVVKVRPPRLHVSVQAGRGLRSGTGLTIHRRRTLERPYEVAGLPVTGLDNALIDTWSHAHGGGRSLTGSAALARAAVIDATRTGRTSAGRLGTLLASHQNMAGRSQLRELLKLIAGGCQSELEIFGLREVLTSASLPVPVQQYRVALPGGPVYLDSALPDVKLGIELDGAAFHGDREMRERDIARDSALAAAGWLILRFSYRRVTADAQGCRRDIEQAYHRRLSRE